MKGRKFIMATRKKSNGTEGITEKKTTRNSKKKSTKTFEVSEQSIEKMKTPDAEVVEVTEVNGPDGKSYDPRTILLTPSDYFEKIKGLKQEAKEEDIQIALDFALSKMEKFKVLKQADAARILNQYVDMFKKEIEIIHAGFTTYVLKKDIEYYMNKLSDKAVFCCELADYPREIPDDIFDKIKDHLDLFDHIYIIFTDYTQKVSKHIDKKTREKDPIMFGAVDRMGSTYKPVVGPRYYFIGDWVDEFCDLTLEQMIEKFKADENYKNISITHDLSIPKDSKDFDTNMNAYLKEVKEDNEDGLVNYSVESGDDK